MCFPKQKRQELQENNRKNHNNNLSVGILFVYNLLQFFPFNRRQRTMYNNRREKMLVAEKKARGEPISGRNTIVSLLPFVVLI